MKRHAFYFEAHSQMKSAFLFSVMAGLVVVPAFAFAQLSGTKTIGTGGNYASFGAAVADLTVQGVSGPVTFEVLSGTYTEQIQIGSISGVSEVNTITFQSQSGNPPDVTLRFTPTSTNNYVMRILQADYVTFQNMTLIASGSTTYGTVVKLDGDANNNRFLNNIITGVSTSSNSTNLALILADGDSLDYTVISGNTLTNGSYGAYIHGTSATVLSSGLQITNNTFTGTGYTSIRAFYQNAPQITGNIITPASSAFNGIEVQYCDNDLRILKNKVTLNKSGNYFDVTRSVYVANCDGGSGTSRGLVANNFIAMGGNTQAFGLDISGSTNQDIYHNSVNITSAAQGGGWEDHALHIGSAAGSSINIINNVLANQTGEYCYYNAGAASIVNLSDYNNLYTNGNYVGYWGGANRTTLAAFQAVSGKDVNSVSVYPHFVSSNDLHTPTPWLDAKGVPLPIVADDIDGNARDVATPDIGADEFTPDPLVTTPLAGAYTIGSGGDYASLAAVRSDLLIKGILGPVTFNFLSGTYTEQLNLQAIPGADAVKTVTFQSQSANAADVILSYPSAGANNNYVVQLDGADYIRFRTMTIASNTSTNASYARVITFFGGVEDFRLENAVLNGSPTNSTSSNQALVYGVATHYTSRIISGNTFNNGTYSVFIEGISPTVLSSGLQITNNTVNTGYTAIRVFYQTSPQIIGNTITSSSGTVNAIQSRSGIEIQYCDNALRVLKNRITMSNSGAAFTYNYLRGITLWNCDGGTGSSRGLLANNFIHVGGVSQAYGLDISACTNQDIYHNSINMTSFQNGGGSDDHALVIGASAGSSINIVNNVLANQTGDFCYSNFGAASIVNISDYNDLYTTGNYVGYWGGANRTTLAAFQAASGKDANSISVYPHFTSSSDLHTPTPWLDAKGTPLAAVTDDFDGDPRNGTTPDIGADEFTPDPSVTTPLAGTYTIGTGGDYASLADVRVDLLIKGVSAAVTFEFLNGTYTGQMNLLAVPGADATKTVTFQSQSGIAADVTLSYPSAGANNNYVIRLDGADYIRLRTMSIVNSSGLYGRVIDIFGGVEDLRIENAILTGTLTSGSDNKQAIIYAGLYSRCTSRIISGNTLNNGTYAIYFYSSSTPTPLPSGLQITSNTFSGTGYRCIELFYQNSPQIIGNTFTPLSNANAVRGMNLQFCDNALQILNNRITMNHVGTLMNQVGIFLGSCDGGSGTSRGLVANNFIAMGGNTVAYGLQINACTNQDIYNNSINITSTPQGGSQTDQALRIDNTSGSSINIANNVLANQTGEYCYYNAGAASIVNISDYNDFYTTGPYIGYWGGADRTSLAEWQAATGKDLHSVAGNPQFVSASDLHVNINSTVPSVVANAGTQLAAITTDIDQQIRSSSPDIGADEFTLSPPAAFDLSSPANGSTDQPLSGTLMWNASSRSNGYDVYLDTSATPTTLVASNVTDTSTSYSVPSFGTTYYWNVVAKNVDATTSSSNGPFSFTTSDLPAPGFSIAPATIGFDTVLIGSNKQDSVTVTNTGTATLTISSAVSDNAAFSVTPSSGSIAPSDSVKFFITFSPTSSGAHSGSVIFDHDASGSPDSITVNGVGRLATVTVSVPVLQNWNMVSLPVSNPEPDDSVKHVFENLDPSVPSAFAFTNQYVVRHVLENGPGYWVKSSAGYTQDIAGTSRDTLTVPVNNGWNMIGSITVSIDTSETYVTPSVPGLRVPGVPFYKFTNSYQPAATIDPGFGYWVRTTQAGSLFMHTTAAPGQPRGKSQSTGTRGSTDELNSMTISDASGASQTLYFGVSNEIQMSMYELPPVPPAGSFDARFAHEGTTVQTHPDPVATNSGHVIEIPIAIQSSTYPITLTWEIKHGVYELTHGMELVQTLQGVGTLRINDEITRVIVRVIRNAGTVPTEFVLHQNYPNPFNPSTSIRYELPARSRVVLHIYNTLGQHITTLVDNEQEAGRYTAYWDGHNNEGRQVASGVYLCRLQVHSTESGANPTFVDAKKLLLIK